MEALNTYKAEKTLAEQMNERLAELKMTKAEAALKMNYSRSALSQYLKRRRHQRNSIRNHDRGTRYLQHSIFRNQHFNRRKA